LHRWRFLFLDRRFRKNGGAALIYAKRGLGMATTLRAHVRLLKSVAQFINLLPLGRGRVRFLPDQLPPLFAFAQPAAAFPIMEIAMKIQPFPLLLALLAMAGCGAGSNANAPTLLASSVAVQNAALSDPVVAAAADSRQFLVNAFTDGMAEINLSNLALQKATDTRVRAFAQRMVNDHTRLNNELSQVAKAKSISLPTTVRPDQQASANELGGLSGARFDEVYMAKNVTEHDNDVAAAMLQAQKGGDIDVRMLASNALPVLELHHAAAKEINNLINPAAFLVSAAADGIFEIRLSQLALQKGGNTGTGGTGTGGTGSGGTGGTGSSGTGGTGSGTGMGTGGGSDDVKQFAQQMITDHTQANNSIAQMAQQKHITLPTDVTQSQQVALDYLQQFSGADFDKAFMDKNVVLHAQAVRQAREQADRGADPEIKALGQQLLPALSTHLARAQQIDNTIEPGYLYRAAADAASLERLAHAVQQQNGANGQLVAFAQQLTPDVAGAMPPVRQLAQQRNVPLPVATTPEELTDLAALIQASGTAFDQQGAGYFVNILNRVVQQQTSQSQNTSDMALNTLAGNALGASTNSLNQANTLMGQLAPGG
jgi:predicted outer membrane protein